MTDRRSEALLYQRGRGAFAEFDGCGQHCNFDIKWKKCSKRVVGVCTSIFAASKNSRPWLLSTHELSNDLKQFLGVNSLHIVWAHLCCLEISLPSIFINQRSNDLKPILTGVRCLNILFCCELIFVAAARGSFSLMDRLQLWDRRGDKRGICDAIFDPTFFWHHLPISWNQFSDAIFQYSGS